MNNTFFIDCNQVIKIDITTYTIGIFAKGFIVLSHLPYLGQSHVWGDLTFEGLDWRLTPSFGKPFFGLTKPLTTFQACGDQELL